MKQQRSNAGRITRVDQAWDAAHREALVRSRVADVASAYGMAIAEDRERFPTNVVPFVREGEVIGAAAPHFMQITPATKDDPETPVCPGVVVPLKILQAAILTAARDDVRYYLNGVYLHAVEGDWRLVSTDGHRMVVTRFSGKDFPEWATEGVIIPREELAQILPMLRRNGTRNPFASVDPYTIINVVDGKVRVIAANAFCSFTITPKEGKFPDYARVLANVGVTIARGEGTPMQAPAIATEYLRSAGDVASRLGATAVHSFISSENGSATFFTFQGAPDSCMVIMPIAPKDDAVSAGVVKILGREGMAASIAAFRAHITRTAKLLTNTTDERERERLEARQEELKARVASLLGTVKQIEDKSKVA